MALLRSATDPRWLPVALGDLARTLADHAHCEKKAAASALKLVADHAERPELVRPLARLAQEELSHLLAVVAEMGRLGFPPLPDDGDPYAQALVRLVRPGGAGRAQHRLVDRLLVGALIEARSHERLALLAGALDDLRLRELYARLAQSEAGHAQLFVELAAAVGGERAVRERLGVLAEEEARVVAALPVLPRIH
jgi:tRNA-(ms[2]io[6]A)-hydroxylase